MFDVTPKYWAFISYSHHDAKVAARLQRWLETYRVPQRLVGPREGLGEVPPYLKPVFRDRDELQAGADLRATVREALAQSRYLIVVCSPEAARSPWVNQEIVEFRKLHGASRVLALIAAGEPFASRIPGREAEECFPEALREVEPIAADLRPQGDGPRLAMLKLVAGMIGVGVDELVRRDAQRRARRMALLATSAVAGMAVMAVLTVMAVQSRNDAQSQRAQAEDLLEFMLGDLRKKLVPVGRLDVLDAVGTKALVYYGKQELRKLDANALGRRSRALHLIGEMREQRGQLEEALQAFNSAAETTAELLQRTPQDGQRIFDHAQSVFWVGKVAWRRGQASLARKAFLDYRDLAQKLVAIDPANVDWQLETAYANQSLGVVQLKERSLEAALQSFGATRETLTRLVALRPALGREIADVLGWTSEVWEVSGDYAAAAETQQRRLEILRGMPDAEKDRRIQRQIANAILSLGREHLYMGDITRANGEIRKAVDAHEELSASDTSNMFWVAELSMARLYFSETERVLGKLDSARAQIGRASADIDRLLKKDPTSLKWQFDIRGVLLVQEAELALAEKRAPALAEFEDFLAAAVRTEASGKVFNSVEALMVARVQLLFGDFLAVTGHRDAGIRQWNGVVARLQPKAGNAPDNELTLLARSYLRLDRQTEARELLVRIESSKYRHPAYADLVNEFRGGTGPSRPSISRR